MKIPLQVTFRDFEPSPAIKSAVRRRTLWLERFYPHITGCRVAIDAPHKHSRQGRQYRVRVDVTVPGAELVANRQSARDGAHEDLYVALRDAFRATRRELQDYARRRRGKVKRHSSPGLEIM
jgi:ribosome-associated translation inhibitor RaiA